MNTRIMYNLRKESTIQLTHDRYKDRELILFEVFEFL